MIVTETNANTITTPPPIPPSQFDSPVNFDDPGFSGAIETDQPSSLDHFSCPEPEEVEVPQDAPPTADEKERAGQIADLKDTLADLKDDHADLLASTGNPKGKGNNAHNQSLVADIRKDATKIRDQADDLRLYGFGHLDDIEQGKSQNQSMDA